MSTTSRWQAAAASRADTPVGSATQVDGAVVGYGLAAAIVIVFNTLLAWIKDSYAPLNSLMAHLSGHHWRTHGLVDVVLFLILGFALTQRNVSMNGYTLAGLLVAASVVAGGGLALWFVLV
jgi:hypothetical protein